MSKFYVTTPIYYVNDKPHIGHTYTTIIADALARFHRLNGEEVWFETGTDENSQKNVQAMEKAGETDLSAYLARMADIWRVTWKDLGITFDDFIRTTEERHLKGVERFWKAVEKSGDLEKRTYQGLYCVGCEGFKIESDLVEGRCPLHPNKDLEQLSEQNWFFKLTDYCDELTKHITENSQSLMSFVQPTSRRNEILNYIKVVKEQKLDVSVSREAKKIPVGIPVPGDDSQRMYVWFDALLNYMTAVGYGTDDERFRKWWPATLQLVGKDILKFHCALWPAMIMSAAKSDPLLVGEDGKPLLPQQVFAHGFFTINGQKISKSLGNAVDPRDLVKEYGFDPIRYYLLREISLGEDGDFSYDRLKERYNSDLGNTFGNLINRSIAMSKKYFNGCIPTISVNEAGDFTTEHWTGKSYMELLGKQVKACYLTNGCDQALNNVWQALLFANKFIEDTQPFKLVKTDEKAVAKILYSLLESSRLFAWMVQPILPETAMKIFVQLGLNPDEELKKPWDKALVWGGLKPGAPLGEPTPLFPRLETTEQTA